MKLTWFIAGLVASAGIAVPATLPGTAELTGPAIVDRVAKNEGKFLQTITQRYTATRHYRLRNERFNREAEMSVHARIEPSNRVFQVLSTTGSESIHNRVFKRLLEGEAEASRDGHLASTGLTNENYNAVLVASEPVQGRLAYVLELKPKKKSKYLIEGKAWVDAADFQVVRLEGRPATSLSFLVGRPHMIYEFRKVGPVWMASRNESKAKTALLGATELIIDFTNYEFGGKGQTRVASAAVEPKRPLSRH